MKRCKTCKHEIAEINYSFPGLTWMHVIPEAAFPTERKGTAWRFCKITVAEPEEE